MSKKILKIGIPVLIILILFIYGFWPRAILVNTARVQTAPLTLTIEDEGKTRVIDRYIINAPVPGVTCRHDLHVGDTVQQDEVLLNLEPMQSEILDPRSRAQAEAKVSAAQSALRAAEERANAAKADAEYAQGELARIEKLIKAGVASREALDKAKTTANSTRAAQRSANFAVDVAKYELTAAQTTLHYSAANEKLKPSEHVPIRSPITGRVLRLHHECEGVVQTGQPLLEVGDTRRLEIEIDVLSEDAVKIVPGMRVQFTRWGQDKPLEGRVRTVEPVGFTKISALGVEEQRVLVIADFVSPYEEWERLGDGYRVEARFILWEKNDVLQLPTSALFQEQGHWYVFANVGGAATKTAVTIGARNGFQAQLLAGLRAGDTVIIHPDDRIQNGTRIKSRDEN